MPCHRVLIVVVFLIISLFFSPAFTIRSLPNREAQKIHDSQSRGIYQFTEAPIYKNGPECEIPKTDSVCDASQIHIAMTLDAEYLRGSVAAIHSALKHTSCPESLYFHLITSDSGQPGLTELTRIVKSAFPYLNFQIYPFDEQIVKTLITPSIRPALDNPLNYARSYIADILDPCIRRVIYLDSDVIVVDEIQTLWSIPLPGSKVIGAPEYCHANFNKYFNDNFWLDARYPKVFEGKRPCYFNTGVMVMDLEKFREGRFRERVEEWMAVQRKQRIYELGSLPPFLLVFGGNIESIAHRWNQHGLGGDNLVNSCRGLHPGPVSLLHWSGKGKPWVRLDAGDPCSVDLLWAPYDLHNHHREQR